jgi:hypothetical protein
LFLASALNGGKRSVHLSTPLPQEEIPVPIEQEAVFASEPVWTFWRREKLLAASCFRTPAHAARSSVTMLYRLQVRREHLRIIRFGKGAKEIEHALGFASDTAYAVIVILVPASNWLLISAESRACSECKQLFMSHSYDLVA